MAAPDATSSLCVLVLGASGQIGHFLLPQLLAHGVAVEAVSRQAQPPAARVHWSRFDLYLNGDAAYRPDIVISAGPLDGLLAWLSRTRHRPGRIVAFSSTSASTKQGSTDPAERELAQRLLDSERVLQLHCQARGIGWTILRPTLVYGCGLDANLSRIAALARRWRVVPLPADAIGRRQPVHAQDLAACAWTAANTDVSLGKRYELCGGTSLTYLEMVRRTVRCLKPPGYVLRLPSWLFRLLVGPLQRLDLVPGLSAAMLDRMRTDLVFSAAEAERDLGWVGRPFQPDEACFTAPDLPSS